MKYISFLLIFIASNVYPQTPVNIQRWVDIIFESDVTPNNPASYIWQEYAYTKQSIHISVLPPEQAAIYVQLNNSQINFHSWNYNMMLSLSVAYDGGEWQQIFHDDSRETSGWLTPPFSSLGHHTIRIKWIVAGMNSFQYRDYDIYVVPACDKFYRDNYGNTLTVWGVGNANPVLVSEGFDAYNYTHSEYLRSKGGLLFQPMLDAGHKIYILNYKYNSQDMRISSAIYSSAATYISNLNSNIEMIAVGVSMGGVIVRYALSNAENNNAALPFKKFISIDSPQQGAVISKELQDYMKDNDPSDYQKHGLDNTAAKELLNYNVYDPTGNIQNTFYNELNNLNGDGYPNNTRNIAVSFSTNVANSGSGSWLNIKFVSQLGFNKDKYITLADEEKVAGSYLPKANLETNPTPLNAFYFIAGMVEMNRYSVNPTFIPHNSSIDFVNGQSKFDVVIQANTTGFHDEFPVEVIEPLLNEVIKKYTIFTQHQTEFDGIENGQSFQLVANLYGNVTAPSQKVINNRIYSFGGWIDESFANPRSIMPTSNRSLTALYKTTQATDNLYCFKNNFQRKIVRTVNGNSYSVYESINRVWLEKKENGTGNWTPYMNSAISLNEGKHPSISFAGNNIFIVSQIRDLQGTYYDPNYAQDSYKIKLIYINDNDVVNSFDVTDQSLSGWNNNATPVVASTQDGRVLVVWKNTTIGLYYRFGIIENGTFVWKIAATPLPELPATVGVNAINPTLAAENIAYPDYNKHQFHLAFQSGNNIYYRQFTQNNLNNFSHDLGTSANITSANGYSSNYQPSIISFDEGVRLAWFARRFEPAEEGFAKSSIDNGTWIYNTLLTNPINPTYFWSWGNNVGSVSFNKYTQGTNDSGYVIGWTENNGASAQFIRNTSFTTILPFVQPSGAALTGVKDIQITNGSDFTNMFGYFLNEGTLNKFVLSREVTQLPSKEQLQPLFSGREGIISKDTAQFYFTFGDVMVDGSLIEFVPIPDTTNCDSLPMINRYLTTQSFTLNDQSEFLYGVRYGITDSMAAIAALSNGNSVSFKVELIDAQTEQIIGVYDEIEFSETNVFQYDNVGYKVNTDGIGSRQVKLRLNVSNTDNVHYSITDRRSNEIFLGKRGINRTTIGFRGSDVITDYTLSQNFPNPFNPITTINYALPKTGNVVMKVYDILGKEVATLVNDHQETGRYSVQFDGSKLASGMYIYKITSGSFSEVKKMMLVK